MPLFCWYSIIYSKFSKFLPFWLKDRQVDISGSLDVLSRKRACPFRPMKPVLCCLAQKYSLPLVSNHQTSSYSDYLTIRLLHIGTHSLAIRIIFYPSKFFRELIDSFSTVITWYVHGLSDYVAVTKLLLPIIVPTTCASMILSTQ